MKTTNAANATELRQLANELLEIINTLQQQSQDFGLSFAYDLTNSYVEIEHIVKTVTDEDIVSDDIKQIIRGTGKHLLKIQGIINDAKDLAERASETAYNNELAQLKAEMQNTADQLTDEELAEEARAMCSILSPRTAIAIANEIRNWLPKEANMPIKPAEYFKYVRHDGTGMLYVQRRAGTYKFVQKIFGNKPQYLSENRELSEQIASGSITLQPSCADAFNQILQTAIEN